MKLPGGGRGDTLGVQKNDRNGKPFSLTIGLVFGLLCTWPLYPSYPFPHPPVLKGYEPIDSK